MGDEKMSDLRKGSKKSSRSHTEGTPMSEQSTSVTERGAFIPPSDMFCSPERAESGAEWKLASVEELKDWGFRPCPVCYIEAGTDRRADQ